MEIKRLSDIVPQMTAHKVGMKRVLAFSEDAASDITQIAVTTLRAGEETDKHLHPSMEEYFLFIKGKLLLTVENETCVCNTGDFVIIRCGEMHQLKAIEDTELLTIGCAIEKENK